MIKQNNNILKAVSKHSEYGVERMGPMGPMGLMGPMGAAGGRKSKRWE